MLKLMDVLTENGGFYIECGTDKAFHLRVHSLHCVYDGPGLRHLDRRPRDLRGALPALCRAGEYTSGDPRIDLSEKGDHFRPKFTAIGEGCV